MSKIKKRRKGFTLIEMVVVIAIVVIIAAIAIPQALKSINKSKASTDFANARTYAGQIMSRLANNEIDSENITKLKAGTPLTNPTAAVDSTPATTGTAANIIGGEVADTKLVKGGIWKAKIVTDAGNDSVEISIGDNQIYPNVKAGSEYANYIK